VIGAGTPDGARANGAAAPAGLDFGAVHAAQAGLVTDMDQVAGALYGRAGAATPTEDRPS
jgi:hypothetical protein